MSPLLYRGSIIYRTNAGVAIRNMPPLAFGIHNEQYDGDMVIVWGYNSRHVDYPGIHGKAHNASVAREGMGDPTSYDVTFDILEIRPPG